MKYIANIVCSILVEADTEEEAMQQATERCGEIEGLESTISDGVDLVDDDEMWIQPSVGDVNMTYQEAIKILDPLTSANTLTEIVYYGGFYGKQIAAAKYVEACKLACQAMRSIEHQEPDNTEG